jgi:ABC-type transport system substrate-binding protein
VGRLHNWLLATGGLKLQWFQLTAKNWESILFIPKNTIGGMIMHVFKHFVSGVVATALLLPVTLNAQELRVGLALEPTSMDPHYHNLTPNNAIARELFDRLVMPNENQQLEPGLAVSWKPVDETTW